MKLLKKALITSSLTLTSATVLLSLSPSPSLGGTLTYTDSFSFQNTDFFDNLIVPKYNGTQPLLSIEVMVTSNIQGTYTLRRTGTSNITYGQTIDLVGASLIVDGPNSSIILNTVPTQNIGTGRLTATNPLLSLNISGTDTHSGFIDPSFFSLYTGTGNVTFNAEASSNLAVSKLGNPFEETANILADASLQITYTYQDSPPGSPASEIPEPSTLLGLLAVGAAGVVSRRRKSYDN
ncbi:protein of unknown function DUF1555 [Rippkaea orientalis PCC 8801]|uniref:Ice-binding protein C-terminal domain-containing protein n=1 Tax=Rippkaea orientalis (strain PCC 8801 / RF-1) TaxID=41431 RepID=B7K3W8_RIPO1|nr:PEP-CTERM sorting domain-containing protein [Rippkaea orientalis]ACK66508.1 protein of unknown function DUF1555 [Rippkaea orientalis PCC 8801]